MISGIAPGVGIYVVTVCVQEIRNGVAIAVQRKDLQLNITGCTVAAASLLPEYMLCGNTQRLTVANQSNSPLISSWHWEFTNSAGAVVYNSSTQTADYNFTTPGTYTIKLTTNRGMQCPDSTEAQAFVYPGFEPRFSSAGACISKPVLFRDETTTRFGTVNFWDWDFGDVATQTDFSVLQHPSWTYASQGDKGVRLIVHNTVGCKDTLFQQVTILDKPPINLAFRDTLICPPDPLQLQANGLGVYTWSPNINMTGANTPNPRVNVTSDTKYYVDLDYDGCLNRDSVMIRAVNQVSLTLPADTVICLGDAITLRPASDGLRYSWAPAASLDDAGIKNPLATPTGSTHYTVTASISNCTATADINVSTVPYPRANAGPDTTICFGTAAALHAATDGSAFTWTPLLPNTLHPIVQPAATTAYILTATDTRGCPKPTIDTVLVTVLPKVNATAGGDTAVVLGQPLQLNAGGGLSYTWFPAAGLSSPFIQNPVITFNTPTRAIRYKVLVQDEAGCADSAFITVKVYNTLPQVFVPTAFTPNGDGANDYLRPIGAGIKEIRYFSVYNRWGQMVFTGTANGIGWDGRINGAPQSTGVYVWQVKAVDYLGYDFFLTGTATLLR
jgi:gliding motility-associated-like protein